MTDLPELPNYAAGTWHVDNVNSYVGFTLSPDRMRSTPADRALLAALLHQLPREVLKRRENQSRTRWFRALQEPAPGRGAATG
jgi:hypothetical protein